MQQSNISIQISQTIGSLRQYKIAGYALFDIALSFLGIYLLAPLLSKAFRKIKIDIPRKSWLYFTLPLGILFHILFGQFTPMTSDFLDLEGHYIIKIIILVLTALGIRDIKIIKR